MSPNTKPDPWTGKPKQPAPRKRVNMPLPAALKKQLAYLKKQLLKARTPPHPLSPQAKSGKRPSNKRTLFNIGFNLILGWILWGFYLVGPDEQAVVTRFGRYYQTTGPGLHWHMRLIDHCFKIASGQPKRDLYTTTALTAEGKLVSITLALHYRIQDARRYLFTATKPIEYLQQHARVALRHAINQYPLSTLFNPQTAEHIRQAVVQHLKDNLTHYPIGLRVTTVELPTLQMPADLKAIVEVTQQAQRQSQHLQYAASAEAIQMVRTAQLQAQQQQTAAEIWQHQTVSQAHAEINRLLMLLPSYEKMPQLTIKRLTSSHKPIETLPQPKNTPLNTTVETPTPPPTYGETSPKGGYT